MAVFVFFYTVLFVAMTVIFHRLIKGEAVMALQDVILLSILNFVGSMIAGVVNGLLIVRIDTDALDLCQYVGQKKSKDYAVFLSSSSSFCCGVK